jgi:hypothetical protein
MIVKPEILEIARRYCNEDARWTGYAAQRFDLHGSRNHAPRVR